MTFWKQLKHVLPPLPGINIRQNSSPNRPAAFTLLLHASDETEPLPYLFIPTQITIPVCRQFSHGFRTMASLFPQSYSQFPQNTQNGGLCNGSGLLGLVGTTCPPSLPRTAGLRRTGWSSKCRRQGNGSRRGQGASWRVPPRVICVFRVASFCTYFFFQVLFFTRFSGPGDGLGCPFSRVWIQTKTAASWVCRASKAAVFGEAGKRKTRGVAASRFRRLCESNSLSKPEEHCLVNAGIIGVGRR